MGRKKVKHEHDPLTTIHITQTAYEFLQQQRYNSSHEPLYKTLNRVLNKYQELSDDVAWFKEAELIARTERNNIEKQLFELRQSFQ